MKYVFILSTTLLFSVVSFAQAKPEKKQETSESKSTSVKDSKDANSSATKESTPATGGFYVNKIDQPQTKGTAPASKNKNSFLPKSSSAPSIPFEDQNKSTNQKKTGSQSKGN